MLFAFSVSVFGFVVAVRTANDFIDQNLFSKNEMTKIGTLYLVLVFFLIMIGGSSRFSFWIAVFLPLMILVFALNLVLKRRARVFRTKMKEVLSLIILKMKSGKSFRQALHEVIDESEFSIRVKLEEISNVVSFSQQQTRSIRDQFISDYVNELKFADHNPHLAMKRLCVFRDKLRVEDDFRHRSGQVLSRIRAQSLILSVLYIAIMTFVVFKFGAKENAKAISISMVFFLLGSLWIWIGGRKMKWKV